MDASLVNVFVSELVKFKTGGQLENMNEAEKLHQVKTEDECSIPKLTEDELTQLHDQMRKVLTCSFPQSISEYILNMIQYDRKILITVWCHKHKRMGHMLRHDGLLCD